MADVLFTNVRIFDGGGETPFQGEVLVQGNRITRVLKSGYGARTAPIAGVQLIDGAVGFGRPQPQSGATKLAIGSAFMRSDRSNASGIGCAGIAKTEAVHSQTFPIMSNSPYPFGG